MNYKWEFGDWGREKATGLIVRFVGVTETCYAFVFRDGSTSRRYSNQVEHLPDCTGFDWKPELKYRPFANAAEFKPYRDLWVKFKEVAGVFRVMEISNDCVRFAGTGFVDYQRLRV